MMQKLYIMLQIGKLPSCWFTCRNAIKAAGATGRYKTPVQFSSSELDGKSAGVMANNAMIKAPAKCTGTLYSSLQANPDLSTLLGHLEKAGKLVESSTAVWPSVCLMNKGKISMEPEWAIHAFLFTAYQKQLHYAGAASMLKDRASTATLFAPINSAWERFPATVDLGNKDILQHVLLYLLAPGAVVVPDAVRLVISTW